MMLLLILYKQNNNKNNKKILDETLSPMSVDIGFDLCN